MSSIYFYLLFALSSLFVLLNLASKALGSRRREHLAINAVILILILVDLLFLLMSGYSDQYVSCL